MEDSRGKFLQRKLTDFEEACHTHGLKVTHQRREIFAILAGASDHPSVEAIYQQLRERIPTVSLDTVYRTLATLERHGLVKRVQTMENQTRYEMGIALHHHFICDRCHRIMDFSWQDFDQLVLPENLSQLGQAAEKSVIVQGLCKECLSQAR